MRDHIKKVVVFLVLATGMVFAFNPVLSSGQNGPKGSIIGFLYDKDGTTPIAGGVVTIKNIGSGSTFASTQTDQFGIFKISGVEKGVYVYGVTTPTGTFNSNALMGVRIKANETAKVSIAVNPFEKDIAESMREVCEEQKAKGEALVGKVIEYNDNQGLADVYILKGYLEVNQRIHAKGNVTNFYQDVKDLKKEGAVSRRLFAGETATLKMRDKAQPGDLVFLVCKRGVLPLFLAPLGIATIIGGSAAIANDNTPDDEPPAQVSTFKK